MIPSPPPKRVRLGSGDGVCCSRGSSSGVGGVGGVGGSSGHGSSSNMFAAPTAASWDPPAADSEMAEWFLMW